MKVTAPPLIKDKCDEFVFNFIDSIMDILNYKGLHDKSWKESNKKSQKLQEACCGETLIRELLNVPEEQQQQLKYSTRY